IEAILTGQPDKVRETINQLEKENIPNLDTCLCAQAAGEILMNIAAAQDGVKIKLLKYANSGDTETGNKAQVVGYGAISFAWQTKSIDGLEFNQEQKEELLKIARQSVEQYVQERKVPSFEIADSLLNQNLGAFVTLKKHGQLRGCIGRFEPDAPLYQVVSQMAISAAVNDTRFRPVQADELSELKYEISVLSPLRKIDDWQEMELGKHGVQIKQGSRSGVFLPQVATENNWDLDKFMGELCSQKAGLDWDCWKTGEVDIYVFTANVFGEE
ncbi:MAG: AmmeMemoRadiSam system protein A, partial [Patescibacteria group bacterium]